MSNLQQIFQIRNTAFKSAIEIISSLKRMSRERERIMETFL